MRCAANRTTVEINKPGRLFMRWPKFRDYVRKSLSYLRIVPRFFAKAHMAVSVMEPWGILLAVIGLAVSIYSFQIDYQDRTVERKLRAWEIVTTPGPVNGGKYESAEFLIRLGNDLSSAELSGIVLRTRNLSGINLANANLSNGIFHSVHLDSANLRSANLSNTNLNGVSLSEANLYEANLRQANLCETDLSSADLRFASLNEAELCAANLSHVDLRGADLRGADLRDADLTRANLLEVSFTNANLSRANLRLAISLFQRQIDAACGDELTELPIGLKIQKCSDTDWYDQFFRNR